MENKKRRKYFVAILFFLFIMLITSTYAWFTANRVVSVETLDVHIQADGGFEVSTDAVNWKQVITVQDIMNASDNYTAAVNQVPYQLNPVSTAGGISNGYLNLYRGTATNYGSTDFLLTATKTEETNSFGQDSDGDFIVFDLFFKTTAPKTLYLSSNSDVVYKGENPTGIENAARVAFLNEGVSSGTAAQNLRGANTALIWEPNFNVHTQSGVENAQNIYGINTGLTGTALRYYGITNPISESDGVLIQNANSQNFPSKFAEVNVGITTPKGNSTNNEVITLQPEVTKLRIYMWIEGQDVDCEDGASYGDLSLNLEFTTNPS